MHDTVRCRPFKLFETIEQTITIQVSSSYNLWFNVGIQTSCGSICGLNIRNTNTFEVHTGANQPRHSGSNFRKKLLDTPRPKALWLAH